MTENQNPQELQEMISDMKKDRRKNTDSHPEEDIPKALRKKLTI